MADKKITWSTARVRLGDLKEWDKNPVKISERDARELAKSIDKYDHVLPYVAAAPLPKGKNKELPLLDGHQRKRVELTLRKGVSVETAVDVRVPSRALTEKERAEIAVRLRKNTGEFDNKKLLEWFGADDLMDWGFDQDELEDIGFEFADESKDTEPQIDRAAELLAKWQVQTGDLWQIGEHRLICGDCTDAAVVARVISGDDVSMVTDPPYGIGYEYDEHDDSSNEENDQLVRKAFEHAPAVKIWTCGLMNTARELSYYPDAKILCWHKGFAQAGSGLGGASTWEPVLVVGAKDATLPNDYLSFSTDREPGLRELHSCPKPVALFQHLIEHLTHGDIYEPFSGSGTTLVACQNLSRRCRAVEISPAYCAVALERMSTAFPDLKIKLVKDGNGKK